MKQKIFNNLSRSTLIIVLSVVIATNPAVAEESLVITLHEQIGEKFDELEIGLEMLADDTPAKVEAQYWLNEAQSAARGSESFDRARAQWLSASAAGLEGDAIAVNQIQATAGELGQLIDQLIDEQSSEFDSSETVFGGSNEDEIRRKAESLKGIDNLLSVQIANLSIEEQGSSQAARLMMAQRSFQMKIRTAAMMLESGGPTGQDELQMLADTVEGLEYLMIAMAEVIDFQRFGLEIEAVWDEVDLLTKAANPLLETAINRVEDYNLEMPGMEYFRERRANSAQSFNPGVGFSSSLDSVIDSGAKAAIRRQR